jgi:hypothetical protein
MEHELQEAIIVMEADLRERDQRIVMLEDRSRELQTALEAAEARYQQVPRLPTQKLE